MAAAALAALACLMLSVPARAQTLATNQDKLDSVVREAVREGKSGPRHRPLQ